MPDILDRLAQERQRQDLEGVALAAKSNRWAETFRNIPPEEVLRSRVNLAETVDRAIRNKLELRAQTDLGALKILETQAKMKAFEEEAPLRLRLKEAQIEATGAAERRRALEATTKAEHTARMNSGFLKLYQSGLQPDTPEFQSQAVDLIASNPFGDINDIAELGKLAGFSSELTPDKYVAEAVKLKKAAAEAGLSNPTIKSFSGRPTVVEGAAVITPEQSIENAVKRKQALQAVEVPKPEKPPKRETFKEWTEELSAAVQAYGGEAKVPKEVWDAFEKRKAAITAPAPPASAPAAPTATGPVAGTDTPGKVLAEIGRNSASPKNIERLKAAGFNVATTATGEAQLVFDKPVTFDNPEDLKASWAIIPSGAIFIDPQGVKRRKP